MTLAPQAGAGIPRATPSAVTKVFWDGCAAGELRFQRCGGCGAAVFTPNDWCRRCQSTDLTWELSGGRAELYTWTVVWRPVVPAFGVPYVPAVVDVAEGYQMMTNVIGCEVDELAVGMPLAVDFHPVDESLTLPYFRPPTT